MKKIILIFIVASTMLTAFSQTEKGKNSIGGSISFFNDIDNSSSNITTSNNNDYLTLNVLSEYGRFIKDNLEVGLYLNIGYFNATRDNTDPIGGSNNYESKGNSYGLGVFTKKYYNITDKLKLFINGNLAYNYEIIESNQSFHNIAGVTTTTTDTQTNSNVYTLEFAPGVVYFVTPKLGFEASFGQINYSYSNSTQKDDSSFKGINNQFRVILNASSLYFGLKYYF